VEKDLKLLDDYRKREYTVILSFPFEHRHEEDKEKSVSIKGLKIKF